MTREEAFEVLGIELGTVPAINEAFRTLSRQCHPDGPTPDANKWLKINEAKKTLLAPAKCPECKGRGRIVTRIARICAKCQGTGWLS